MSYKIEPFRPAAYPPSAFDPHTYIKRGLTREEAEAMARDMREDTVFMNSTYQVAVKPCPVGDGWPAMVHLSIKRRDKEPIRDWRVLQAIKNALVGPQNEAVELFPAEDRLLDTANQHHLWAFIDPTVRLPFGFTQKRLVTGVKEAAKFGAVQRPLPI